MGEWALCICLNILSFVLQQHNSREPCSQKPIAPLFDLQVLPSCKPYIQFFEEETPETASTRVAQKSRALLSGAANLRSSSHRRNLTLGHGFTCNDFGFHLFHVPAGTSGVHPMAEQTGNRKSWSRQWEHHYCFRAVVFA